jgi:hypothetical protein
MTTLSARPPELLSRQRVPAPLIAAGGVIAVWASLWVVIFPLDSLSHWNDFISEAWVPYQLLAKGEALRALQFAPAYYGSLILRAPFGLLGSSLSSRWGLPYVLSAAPCLAAAPILGAWLTSTRGPAANARPRWRWCSPLGLLMAVNPVFLYCVALGHPEQILSAVLAVAAVITASRGRPATAMVLIALAAFDQPWALAAVPVAFVIVPQHRRRAFAALTLALGVLFIPTTLLRSGPTHAVASLGGGVGQIFYPQQLWWWFGPHAWVSVHAHELILLAGALSAGLWWFTHRSRSLDPSARLREGLLLLALVLLLRAVMDPWNNLYYELPFLIVLYTLYAERPGVHLLIITAAMFTLTMPLATTVEAYWGGSLGSDLYAGAYQLLTVPMIALFALRLYGTAALWSRVRGRVGTLLPPI